MLHLTNPHVLQTFARQQAQEGLTLALVPTMGNLHAGHLALIKLAQRHAQRVVVSLFVNPTQFGPAEDFDSYPRTLAADLALCQAAGVSAVFAPQQASALYPLGLEPTQRFALQPPAALANRLCGAQRAGHFDGVALVVLKLLLLCLPGVVVFGEKDAQQVAVVQALLTEFALPTQLQVHPVVREVDGLALSSRNQYLSAPERQAALALVHTLRAAQALVQAQPQTTSHTLWPVEALFAQAEQQVGPSPLVQWQYQAAVHATTFEPQQHVGLETRLLVAAMVGRTRLIDTLCVGAPLLGG